MRKSTRVGQAVVAVVAVVAVGSTGVYASSHGSSSSATDDQLTAGHPEQILIAKPGGPWEQRGADGINQHLDSWSLEGMMPGEESSRSYVIRNMDARAGTWRVGVGEPQLSENAFLALGSEAQPLGLPGPGVAPEAVPAIPEAPDTWLVGPGTKEREGLESAIPGSLLAEVHLGSCEAAAITDWVQFPDVTDHYYMDASTRPKLHATFTPATGEPDEFVDGDCASALAPPAQVGSSERCHGAMTSFAAMLGLLALFGVLAAVSLPVLWPMINHINRELQEQFGVWDAGVAGTVKRLSESWIIPAAFGVAAAALATAACAPPQSSTSSAGTR